MRRREYNGGEGGKPESMHREISKEIDKDAARIEKAIEDGTDWGTEG